MARELNKLERASFKKFNEDLLRSFTCGLTGDECVIVRNAFNEEVCLPKSEYLEIKSNVAHDKRELEMERG